MHIHVKYRKLTGREFRDRYPFDAIRTYQQNRLVGSHLEGSHDKSSLAVEFRTR